MPHIINKLYFWHYSGYGTETQKAMQQQLEQFNSFILSDILVRNIRIWQSMLPATQNLMETLRYE